MRVGGGAAIAICSEGRSSRALKTALLSGLAVVARSSRVLEMPLLLGFAASRRVMSCHVMSSRVAPYPVMSYHVMLCHRVSRRVASRRVLCHVPPCRVALCLVASCRVMLVKRAQHFHSSPSHHACRSPLASSCQRYLTVAGTCQSYLRFLHLRLSHLCLPPTSFS